MPYGSNSGNGLIYLALYKKRNFAEMRILTLFACLVPLIFGQNPEWGEKSPTSQFRFEIQEAIY
jgi:hypothetical protein